MSDATEPWVQHFAVTYDESELAAFARFATARSGRRYVAPTLLGLVFLAIPAIGLAVFGVFQLGLIGAAALKPVLFSAYAAFVAGATSYRWVARRLAREFYRTFARNNGTWHFSFDDSGISFKTDLGQTHMPWSTITLVEDAGWAVMFPYGNQGFFLPSRAFSDPAARSSFVTASAARAKAAREALKNLN